MKAVRLRVHGRVQGVFFRDSMRAEAQRLGVGGWVRNDPDGTVEALVSGEPGAVDGLVAWAHAGPDGARVERIEATDESPPGDGPRGFEVR
jgi:acylphosphatase